MLPFHSGNIKGEIPNVVSRIDIGSSLYQEFSTGYLIPRERQEDKRGGGEGKGTKMRRVGVGGG